MKYGKLYGHGVNGDTQTNSEAGSGQDTGYGRRTETGCSPAMGGSLLKPPTPKLQGT